MNDRHDKLKALTRLAIRKAGNLDVASEATGISIAALSNAQRGENGSRGNWLNLPEIDALEQFIGAPVITVRLSSEYTEGHQPIPHNTDISASNLLTFANSEAKEKLERDQAVERSLQDGEISNAELDRLIKEQEDVIAAAQKHHDWLCAVRTARRRQSANVQPMNRRAN
jgi:hypothetical protein